MLTQGNYNAWLEITGDPLTAAILTVGESLIFGFGVIGWTFLIVYSLRRPK